MINKAPVVIGGVFIAYLVFVGVTMTVYEPSPDDRPWEDRQEHNARQMSDLEFGYTIKQVNQLLGSADFVEAKQSDDGNFKLMYYRTHHQKSDSKTTKDECTPLLFKDSQLIAWGQDTIAQYMELPVLLGLNN
ncbi:DUF3192 domain-containing protein [Shewanella sp. WXL01]|uniref:DUF3192 domain-containing protein n=1 Tax=Shewanella maritima TaxID=2520507 RepID=A0A411PDX8_9GAMM|nr:DUF3192 domain-containing protein [Shewanella maritima]NKF50225.1 DUF3192 domain-containing protein [Shewanella sp. WXL01]QBF81741.1 DUF3192 domain-containing protein [Shewanella maritima]